jgi:hypothetical protein
MTHGAWFGSGDEQLTDWLESRDSRADERRRHTLELESQAYRWFRAGGLYRGGAPEKA